VSSLELLDSARAGDEDAFARLLEPHRAGLYVHCYRMLGSPDDAEDALQETLLRAWRGLSGFEGRSSPRSWLYAIATNSSLRVIERRARRVLPLDHGPAADPNDGPGPPLSESVWVQPLPDSALEPEDARADPEARYEQRESVELAFIAALQLLPPRQRAVLILRDVLGFSAREVAGALDATPASVDSALQRAHRTLDQRLPTRSQQDTLRDLDDDRLRALVQRYVEAWERADVDALAAMLTEEVTMSMPPLTSWFRGRRDVTEFLSGWPLDGRLRWSCKPFRANGQLAFAHYLLDAEDGSASAHSITVVDLDGERIGAMTAFLMPELFERFGLPRAHTP